MHQVIGLGTGRCGTRSLTTFFKEHGIDATHEKFKLRWNPYDEPKERVKSILKELKADVGFYWLNYVPLVKAVYPKSRFVCLERDKKDVIKSFMKQPKGGFHPVVTFLKLTMMDKHGVQYYRETVSREDIAQMDESTREFVEFNWHTPLPGIGTFPDYNTEDAEVFLNKYCDDYHKQAVKWEDIYPEHFLRIDMNYALNTDEGRNKILNHIGVAPDTATQ